MRRLLCLVLRHRWNDSRRVLLPSGETGPARWCVNCDKVDALGYDPALIPREEPEAATGKPGCGWCTAEGHTCPAHREPLGTVEDA